MHSSRRYTSCICQTSGFFFQEHFLFLCVNAIIHRIQNPVRVFSKGTEFSPSGAPLLVFRSAPAAARLHCISSHTKKNHHRAHPPAQNTEELNLDGTVELAGKGDGNTDWVGVSGTTGAHRENASRTRLFALWTVPPSVMAHVQ